jgi:predicted Zn-ribbon and HTH transcriptional regulator
MLNSNTSSIKRKKIISENGVLKNDVDLTTDENIDEEQIKEKIQNQINKNNLDDLQNDINVELDEIKNNKSNSENINKNLDKVKDKKDDDEKIIENDYIIYKGKTYRRGKTNKTFAILDGDVDVSIRKKIIDIYNSPENLDGQILALLLVTTVGSRGINLIACKHSHYFEPYWYLFRLLQFETRAIRDGSHLMLPDDEQETQLFIYLSILPEMISNSELNVINNDKNIYKMEAKDKAINEKETTDEVLYYRSLHRQAQLDKFLDLMKEVSIECPHINRMAQLEGSNQLKINCKLCSPLGNTLYTDNIFDEINKPSKCSTLKEEKIETKIIKYNNIEYGYSQDNSDAQSSIFNIAFYEYDDLIKSYIKIEENSNIFHKLFEEIYKNN